MDKNELRKYIKEDTTAAEYDAFRLNNEHLDLLSSYTLRIHYGGWKNLKALLGYTLNSTGKVVKQYTESELIAILEPHKEFLVGHRDLWDKRVKQTDLPNSTALISFFGSWNNMKKKLDLPLLPNNRPAKYTKEQIENIYRQYAPTSFSPRQWNKFRREHPEKALPSAITINNYLSVEERKKIQQETYPPELR